MKHTPVVIKYILLLFLFLTVHSLAEAQVSISGKIRDSKNHSSLAGATVRIPELNISAISDSLGNYHIKNINRAAYLLEVSMVGYATHIETIDISSDVKKDYELGASATVLNEVVVTGVSSATDKQKTPIPLTTVSNTYLLQNSSTNVIDAIAKTPGVSGMTNGQSISKPVIRGLGYNRVLTINDGVQQVDQAWFDEFGIEADGNAVNRYEILKGPGSLAYGSDAIAGVINLIPEAPLPEGQTKGDVLFNYQTNNGLINNMFHLAGTKNGIAWSARVDNTVAHAYHNKYDGYVLNSQFSNFNADATVGIHRKWGYSQLHASYFDLRTGIVDGTRDSVSGKMVRPVSYPDLNGGEPTYVLPTHQEQVTYTPFVINQKIRHTKVVWDNNIAAGSGRIKGIFSWQKNQRQENNDPTIPDVSDIYYSSNAATYDMRYISSEEGTFTYSAGVNGVYQSSKSLGTLLLIPNYNFFEIGAFAIANKKIGNLNLSGGIRYDTRTFNGLDHWVDSTTQAPAAPNTENSFHEFQGFKSHFNGISFSLGGAYNFTKDVFVKANLSRGWRAPNVAEAAANGVHDGTVVYEIGDHDIKPETSLEEDIAFGVNSKDVDFEIDLFNNHISNFIYARGLKDAMGADSINNSLNAVGLGAAPVYKYSNGSAQLYGGEIAFNVHPSSISWVELNTTFSYVYGHLLNSPDSTKYLPFVPPTRITADLKFPVSKIGSHIKNAYFKAGMLTCFQQNDVYRQYAIYNGLNTELTPYEYAAASSATKGYVLFNAGAGGDIVSKGKTICSLYIICNNIFNTAYIDYMSRFKYLPVNYTTGRVGVYNMGRNLSIKLLIPLNFSGTHI
ncbi:MAG: TonB-dependent receptor [Bacteroidota bacterium]